MRTRVVEPKSPDSFKRGPIVPPETPESARAAASGTEGVEVEPRDPLKVLIVDSDKEQRARIAGLLNSAYGTAARLTTFGSFDAGLRAVLGNSHDVCLFGERAGRRSGLELLRESIRRGCRTPIIVVTAEVSRQADIAAMQAGAADYLVLGTFDMAGLEHAIRNAMDRCRTLSARRESEQRFRTLVEQELHDTNADLQAVLNAAPLAVIALDADGAVRSWNPAAEHMFGWSAAEVVGRRSPTIPPDQMAQASALWERALAGETIAVECPRLTKNGRRIDVCVALAPVAHRGIVDGMISIVSDMSERKQLEEQLRQAQKMEAIGRLAGGIAHDFNNLLTAILGYAELLTDSLTDQACLDDVFEIKRAANRAAGLTRQLLAFSRRQVLLPAVLDLNAVVANMDSMLRRLIGEDIELSVELRPGPHKIEADSGQIEQVILNLALNARDAMPAGGRLTIEATRVELDEAYALIHPEVVPGRYIMLAVSDTGCGMDMATRARIFEPFFTTKQDGRGTGLGLATVYGIVKQSGGWVWAYSEPGQGTSFTIYLPAVDSAVTAVAKVAPLVVNPDGRGEIVLLVEDEQGVRDLVASVLRRGGYGVITAANGPDAIALLNTCPEAPSLVLTDVVMPLMSGPQLVGVLHAHAPELKVIYMSGYADQAIVHHGILAPGAHYLQKPFTPAALTGKVRQVLDAAGPLSLAHSQSGVPLE